MAPTTIIFLIISMNFWTIIFNSCNVSSTISSAKFPAILIFGDSTVDTGNNNYIVTVAHGNHYPYGKDFPGHVATGRFSNGKLVPDFLASMLKIKDTVPPFLDPKLSNEDLLTGVSFASGGSGYDDLTSLVAGVIPVSKQIEYFKKYVKKIEGIVGKKEAKKTVNGALVIISAGINDFDINFYDIPTRRLEFDISGYQDFLQNKIKFFIEELYELGCRKIVVAGLPPIGCLPIQMILKFENLNDRKCVDSENSDAKNYNKKLERLLLLAQAKLPGCKIVYADIYSPILDMINQPHKYGFVETKVGCCGTGLLEVGPLCNSITLVCDKASDYLFFDSIHPTEAAYKYLTDDLAKKFLPKLSYDNESQLFFSSAR